MDFIALTFGIGLSLLTPNITSVQYTRESIDKTTHNQIILKNINFGSSYDVELNIKDYVILNSNFILFDNHTNIDCNLKVQNKQENDVFIVNPSINCRFNNVTLKDGCNKMLLDVNGNVEFGFKFHNFKIISDLNVGYSFINKYKVYEYVNDNDNFNITFGCKISYTFFDNEISVNGSLKTYQSFSNRSFSFRPSLIENYISVKFTSRRLFNTNFRIYAEFEHLCIHPEISNEYGRLYNGEIINTNNYVQEYFSIGILYNF